MSWEVDTNSFSRSHSSSLHSNGFSLLEVVVTLAVISIIATLSLSLVQSSMSQLRFASITHAKLGLRKVVSDRYFSKVHGNTYEYEKPPGGDGRYTFTYDPDYEGGPLYLAKPSDSKLPELSVQIVTTPGKMRAKKSCTRGLDEGLWKACDEWTGWL